MKRLLSSCVTILTLIAFAGPVAPKLAVSYDPNLDAVLVQWSYPYLVETQAFEVERVSGGQTEMVLINPQQHQDNSAVQGLAHYAWRDIRAEDGQVLTYRVRARQEVGGGPFSKPQQITKPKAEQ